MDARDRAHEQVLVLRCQAGDREAFAGLFERYQAALKYYLRRLLDSPELADDVLQTVWLKALHGVKRLRQPGAFRTWLYRIARNEALQQLKRDRRWTEVQESLPVPEEEEQEEHFTADAARIHAALAQLSPPHREVLVLRFLEDLSYEEIAAIVDCSVGTVRSRIHYAKRAMKHILKE
jgi:RNA polymerase sigma-70 factor (ECF subfamily)